MEQESLTLRHSKPIPHWLALWIKLAHDDPDESAIESVRSDDGASAFILRGPTDGREGFADPSADPTNYGLIYLDDRGRALYVEPGYYKADNLPYETVMYRDAFDRRVQEGEALHQFRQRTLQILFWAGVIVVTYLVAS